MSAWEDFLGWMTKNPGAAGAGAGILATLLDPAKDTTTTTQQNVQLPSYIAPYVGRMLNRAESISGEGYIPYSEPRLADFNSDQIEYRNRILNRDSMTPEQTQGAGIVGQAAENLLSTAGKRWDQSEADHYMSPYMQSVVDIQKREALRDWEKQAPSISADAARSGAFGGSRHGLVEAEAQRNLNQRLADIQAQGLQSAYTNAQGQFNADMNRTGNLYGQASGAGQTLAGIGQQGFQNQLANDSALLGVGDRIQGHQQKSLDIGYQDFLNQRDDPLNKLKMQQGFLTGLPMTQYATANTTPAPTMGQQIVSSGIGGFQLGTQLGGK